MLLTGFEPVTSNLQKLHSTLELQKTFGEKGTRTHNVDIKNQSFSNLAIPLMKLRGLEPLIDFSNKFTIYHNNLSNTTPLPQVGLEPTRLKR